MTLRRTGITRKTQIKRSKPMPRAKRELRARVTKTIGKQRRDTGPTPAQRNLVLDRAAGCCELCQLLLHDGTTWTRPHAIHHRRARGMGSTTRPETNLASNLLLLCGTGNDTGCHGMVESDRARSYALGWLVRQTGDPAQVPIMLPEATIGGLRFQARTVFLTADGDYQETA